MQPKFNILIAVELFASGNEQEFLNYQPTSHLHGLKARGSSYFVGFRCTAGGQTITAQPAGMVYPALIANRIGMSNS